VSEEPEQDEAPGDAPTAGAESRAVDRDPAGTPAGGRAPGAAAEPSAAPGPPERVTVPEGVESTLPEDAPLIQLPLFEGPLDLLLYLIRKENLDILDIPMAPLTRQYLEYVDIMRSKNLELAAEYLVMAAMLMEIKSRLLLPRPPPWSKARPAGSCPVRPIRRHVASSAP